VPTFPRSVPARWDVGRSSPSAPEQKTELNRIIVPIDNDQLSAGVDFKDLKSYQRCPAN